MKNGTKIFGIGFQKTGTTSLDYALRNFGFRSVGYSPELLDDIKKNDFVRVKEKVVQADLFQDNPWPLIYKELDELFPNSKFILTERDAEKWYKSMLNHFGSDESKMREWIYGAGSPKNSKKIYMETYFKHYLEVKEYFSNRPNDLLVVNWEKGEGWKELCSFLDLEIPQLKFPHVNKKNERLWSHRFVLRSRNSFLRLFWILKK